MADTARDAILTRLRQGLEASPFAESPQPLPESPVEPCTSPDAAWKSVAEALEPIAGELHLAQDRDEARAILLRMLRTHGEAGAIRWRHPLLEELGLDDLLTEAGAPLHEAGEAPLCPEVGTLGVGVTAADALFALAGTLVMMAHEGRPRSASLVPPVHIACVPQSALYQDLSSLPGLLRQRIAEGTLPSAVHLTTGSSSTADIEQTLVRPAHGPALVLVVGCRWL